MAKAIVLGGGMVGSVMAADLAREDGLEVSLADLRPEALEQARSRCDGITGVQADLSDPARIGELVADYDLVCGALASHLGLAALEAVIDAGKPYADISFMAEDALGLNEKARAAGVTCIVDCGVAPGMSNLLAARGVALLERAERVEILVGGLPVERSWPWEYKAGFAPADVIEEYTRPSRIVEGGETVVREALSEPELIEFEGLGSLESFNTDGLRSLAETLDVPCMIEKTLRYPGHIELMRVLRHAGFFSKQPLQVGDVTVRPLDVTSALMFPQWTYEEGEQDLTVMRITVEGQQAGGRVMHRWDLDDRYSVEEQATSMSRTTALPCALVARMLLSGEIDLPGVHAPEALGTNATWTESLLQGLAERGVRYTYRESRLG
jgi:saccharopine dehydrogenase-like NADP-dependent oxidoreductase